MIGAFSRFIYRKLKDVITATEGWIFILKHHLPIEQNNATVFFDIHSFVMSESKPSVTLPKYHVVLIVLCVLMGIQ